MTWLGVGLILFLIWEESIIKGLVKLFFKSILSVLVILVNPPLLILTIIGLLFVFH